MKTITQGFIFLLCSLIWLQASGQMTDHPNIIFIIVDDLNDFASPFNNDEPQIQTPNIARLADSATIFLNAFVPAPGCAPSRTCFLSGKDVVYTNVFGPGDYENEFRENFNAARGNEEVFTLPEILKDSGGYFTYGINKIYHNPDLNDFDTLSEMCDKSLSWNRVMNYDEPAWVDELMHNYLFEDFFPFGMIPDSIEPYLKDVVATDSAIQFIQDVADGTADICGSPFFLALGLHYPHAETLIPEKYFLPFYQKDLQDVPFQIPYNQPQNCFPYNGVVMTPQPEIEFADYWMLPDSGIAQVFANDGSQDDIELFVDTMTLLPEIDPDLTDSMRREIIKKSIAANTLICYLAAIEFADAQIGRLMDEIYTHPELASNTIIVLIGDNGFTAGEKRHWSKWTLWEPDIRVPFIILDPSKPSGQVVNSVVSLMDIFPTVCDLANVSFPSFDNGSDYLDGKSLVPYLSTPGLKINQPALTTISNNSGVGDCYPHFSVRNERFHYIMYRQNNDGSYPEGYCDDANVTLEEELYEIGTLREVDPHEWNNLAADSNYAPLISYLQQWMPDSIFYMQPAYTAEIESGELNCFLLASDTLHLSMNWYLTDGTPAIPDTNFIYQWSTNLTSELTNETEFEFLLSSVDPMVYEDENKLIVYLQVFDSTGNTIAFDMRYFFLDSAEPPFASFTISPTDPYSIEIIDFDIDGSYTSYSWDTGNENEYMNSLPGPLTFGMPGEYPVSLIIQYGNGCADTITQFFSAPHCDSIPPAYYYFDADHDGFGDADSAIFICSMPEGYVNDFTDCNDSIAEVNPASVELCTNLIDDNCNGLTDETDVIEIFNHEITNDLCINPFILLSADTDAGNFQWYKNDLIIDGAITNEYNVSEQGIYSVKVTDTVSNCISESGAYEIIHTCLDIISESGKGKFILYPNPAAGHFILLTPASIHEISLSFYDVQGNVVWSKSASVNSGDQLYVSLDSLSNGVYLLRIRAGDIVENISVVVSNPE